MRATVAAQLALADLPLNQAELKGGSRPGTDLAGLGGADLVLLDQQPGRDGRTGGAGRRGADWV